MHVHISILYLVCQYGWLCNLFVTMRTLTIWKGREWEGKGSGGRTRMTKEEKGRGDGKRGVRKGGMMHVTIYFLSNLQLHANMLNSWAPVSQ